MATAPLQTYQCQIPLLGASRGRPSVASVLRGAIHSITLRVTTESQRMIIAYVYTRGCVVHAHVQHVPHLFFCTARSLTLYKQACTSMGSLKNIAIMRLLPRYALVFQTRTPRAVTNLHFMNPTPRPIPAGIGSHLWSSRSKCQRSTLTNRMAAIAALTTSPLSGFACLI